MAINSLSTGFRPGVCTSSTRPTAPFTGQMIFETDTFVLNFWNGTAWQGAVSAPAGTVNPYAGSTAPTGWLLCYGQTVSRTTYATLFAVLSTTYNIGGEAGTDFRLPDLRGRAVAGLDNMGGTAALRLTNTVLTLSDTLGATGGTQTHTMTSAEMPSHTHTQNIHGHAFNDPGFIPGVTNISVSAGGTGFYGRTASQGLFVGDATATNQNTGGGGAHLNTQPTIVLNYIIKF